MPIVLSESPRVLSKKRRPRATASSWGEAYNTSCALAATHSVFFSMPLEKKNYDALLPRARQKPNCGVLVDTVDRERAAFIKRYFHVEWPNRSVYHAMLNTAAGDDIVIQVILIFLQQTQSTGLAD